jgi:hypothetical protein
MPIEFQEYKRKRKPINFQHKFPLIRLMLLSLAAFLAYWSGLASKIANALPLPENGEKGIETWDSRCKQNGGTPFELQHGLAQCSWVIEDSVPLTRLPNPFLRYVASLRKGEKSKLHWVAPVDDFYNAVLVLHEDSLPNVYFRYMKEDSSYIWVSKNSGCKFPGVCPRIPLEWSALPIDDGFDFEGQESLLAMDVFMGIGEAPIYPVLSGRVIEVGRDSSGFFVEIDHGYNVTSRTSGMGAPSDSLSVGDRIEMSTVLGRLSPKDSAAFFLSVRLNGQFVRWTDFYASTHPVLPDSIESFEKSFGF